MNRMNRDCHIAELCPEAHPGAEAIQVAAPDGDRPAVRTG